MYWIQQFNSKNKIHILTPWKQAHHQKFLGGGGFEKLKVKKQISRKLNWNFLGGGGIQNKNPSRGGVWIFFRTEQCNLEPR